MSTPLSVPIRAMNWVESKDHKMDEDGFTTGLLTVEVARKPNPNNPNKFDYRLEDTILAYSNEDSTSEVSGETTSTTETITTQSSGTASSSKMTKDKKKKKQAHSKEESSDDDSSSEENSDTDEKSVTKKKKTTTTKTKSKPTKNTTKKKPATTKSKQEDGSKKKKKKKASTEEEDDEQDKSKNKKKRKKPSLPREPDISRTAKEWRNDWVVEKLPEGVTVYRDDQVKVYDLDQISKMSLTTPQLSRDRIQKWYSEFKPLNYHLSIYPFDMSSVNALTGERFDSKIHFIFSEKHDLVSSMFKFGDNPEIRGGKNALNVWGSMTNTKIPTTNAPYLMFRVFVHNTKKKVVMSVPLASIYIQVVRQRPPVNPNIIKKSLPQTESSSSSSGSDSDQDRKKKQRKKKSKPSTAEKKQKPAKKKNAEKKHANDSDSSSSSEDDEESD